MSIIMKLRQARNVEQIAQELEPLAQSLAALADQAQTSIQTLEAASQRQAREWSDQQASAAQEVKTAANYVANYTQALQKATASLQETVKEVQQAQRNQFWSMAGLAFMSSILAAVLSSALVLWLTPAPQVQTSLDPKAVAESLRRPLIESLRRR
jgi:hypothetical protein